MDILEVIKNLEELEHSLKCPSCENLCQNPVRIMTCGEYFCERCIEKSSNECPSCNEFFFSANIDHKNLARNKKINDKLKNLKKIVLQPKEIRNDNKTEKKESDLKNTFAVGNNLFHVNFYKPYAKLNTKGENPLHVACRKKNIASVTKLLEQKLDINAKDYAGWAPLHEAVESKSLEVVEILLKQGALINVPGEAYTTALHKAASGNDLAMVTLLLKYGANRDAVDYYGCKPFDVAKNSSVKDELLKDIIPNKVINELYIANQIVAYCHSIDNEYIQKLSTSKHIKIEKEMSSKKKITHFFIKKTHRVSFKILQAILERLQFVPQELVDDYLMGEYFIPIPEFIFIFNNKLNNGIKRAMISSLFMEPLLFHGINFFIENHNKPICIYNLKVDKEFLSRLITSGGGHLLHRAPALRTCDKYYHPYHATKQSSVYRCCNYIIFEESNAPQLKYNMAELLHRSSRWLIDCIISFKVSD